MAANPIDHVVDSYLFGFTKYGEFVMHWPADGVDPLMAGPFPLVITQHMLGVMIVSLLVYGVMTLLAEMATASVDAEHAPRGKFANFFEPIVMYIRNEMLMPSMGSHGLKYLPYFLTFFFFILFSNLIGLVPGMGTVTSNWNVTFALAVIVFLMIFVFGSIENGGLGKLVLNMVPSGLPWPIWPLLFVIEVIIGPLVKGAALCIRLFANMVGGHLVITVLLGMGALTEIATLSVGITVVSTLAAVAMGLLEIFIAFLQAYIFTLLAIIFVGMAVHPEH